MFFCGHIKSTEKQKRSMFSVEEIKQRIFTRATLQEDGTLWHCCNALIGGKDVTSDLINEWYSEAIGASEIKEMPEYDCTSKDKVWFIRTSFRKLSKEMDDYQNFWAIFLQIINSVQKCAEISGIELDKNILAFFKEEFLYKLDEDEDYVNFERCENQIIRLLTSLTNVVQLVIVLEDFEHYKEVFCPGEDEGNICGTLFTLGTKGTKFLSASILLVSEDMMSELVKVNLGQGSDLYAAYEKQEEVIE